MKRRSILAIVLVLIAVITATRWFLIDTTTYAPEVVAMFDGAKTLGIVTHPSSVKAYRVLGPSEQESRVYPSMAFQTVTINDIPFPDVNSTEIPIIGEPVVVSASDARNLASLLTDAASYDWKNAMRCGAPIYGVRLSFVSWRGQVDILLCFKCDELGIHRDGKLVGGEDFGPIQPQLLEICKRLFPNDAIIQGIKRRGENTLWGRTL